MVTILLVVPLLHKLSMLGQIFDTNTKESISKDLDILFSLKKKNRNLLSLTSLILVSLKLLANILL